MAFVITTDVPSRNGGIIRLIELNRPEKLNCLSLSMLNDLLSALQTKKASTIILTGAGRAFCTGLDLKEITGPNGAKEHLRLLISIYKWLLTAKLPVIAFAKGYAAGGGAGLVACATTAIVSSDFHFLLPAGDLAPLASVVVPIFNFRAPGKPPRHTGWLGCELTPTEAHRLHLVDIVVSPKRLDELIRNARDGQITPEFVQLKQRNESSLAETLLTLEHYATSKTRSPSCDP